MAKRACSFFSEILGNSGFHGRSLIFVSVRVFTIDGILRRCSRKSLSAFVINLTWPSIFRRSTLVVSARRSCPSSEVAPISRQFGGWAKMDSGFLFAPAAAKIMGQRELRNEKSRTSRQDLQTAAAPEASNLRSSSRLLMRHLRAEQWNLAVAYRSASFPAGNWLVRESVFGIVIRSGGRA